MLQAQINSAIKLGAFTRTDNYTQSQDPIVTSLFQTRTIKG